MELGDLKKWHIGLGLPIFFGLLVFAFLMIEPDNGGRTSSETTFEFEVTSKPVGKTNPQPVVQNIHVFPPVNGYYLVRYDKLEADTRTDTWKKQEWSFTAKTGNNRPNMTVPEWLASLQKQYPDRVSFTYEWWREPKRLWTIWGVFSGLMVLWGVVLPTISWVAKGGVKELNANLNPTLEPELGMAKASGPTAEDHDKLESMLDRLEEETAGVGTTAASAAGGTDRPAVPTGPVVLTGKPLEAVPLTDEEKEARDYKGEFYPVARSGKK